MSKMFKNYPQPEGYVPNNRPRCCRPHDITIMAGETAEHSFEIPFNIGEVCNNVEVIYKLGLTDVLVKDVNSTDLYETEHGNTIIKIVLSSVETVLFAHTLLNASVQIKFYMKDGEISYSEIYPIKLSNALDATKSSQPGDIIVGIGYTED